tara:strand:+ start:101784 stop:102314 length:531 start_codon:yes stop_codon:yes gene_type:complete
MKLKAPIDVIQNPTAEDVMFMKMAVEYASGGTDTSTRNGAVLVDSSGNHVLARNGIPDRHGVKITDARLNERPLKYNVIEHAEDGTIFEAARQGVRTEGSTVYCPWYACSGCAVSLICAGVARIVGHMGMLRRTPERWMEDVDLGFEMLHEAGIKCEAIDTPLGLTTLMNGEEIEL